MNVTELARRINISPEELRLALPQLGFDIGGRAVKVDDRTAWRIIQTWPRLKREWEKLQPKKEEEVEVAPEEIVKKTIILPAVLTVREFAVRLNLPTNKVITELMKNGILASLNERLDYATASILAEDLGFIPQLEQQGQDATEEVVIDVLHAELEKEKPEDLKPRPPVVVVMGHVDHGKTKLLDAIRKTNVIATEAGGITQHIGAYQAQYKDKRITFIDTPGHAAFTTMRSRGARVADVAVLVVAADDGVQPQTLEALKIIHAARLPFLVAVNKIDKEGADQERVKSQLAQENIISEEWSGKIPFVPISAKAGTGIDNLLETLLLLAEMDKDKIMANPASEAMGTVIESHLNPGEGAVATVLVQNGTLRHNDYLVFSAEGGSAKGGVLLGRVRAMRDWNGQLVEEAPPGMPARILGFKVVPSVGDIIHGQKSAAGLEKAKATFFKAAPTTVAAAEESKKQEAKYLPIILKTDMQGSLEALTASLEKFQNPEVAVKVVAKDIGQIGEADVSQAEAAEALVYGFNVEPSEAAINLAGTKGVVIKTYKIIYELLDDVKNRLEAMLAPEVIRTELGRAVILKIFRAEKTYSIAGGRVEDGKLLPGSRVKITRQGAPVGEGELSELQSGKQTVSEVRMGSEFGMKISTRLALQEGDILEAYLEEKKSRKLNF